MEDVVAVMCNVNGHNNIKHNITACDVAMFLLFVILKYQLITSKEFDFRRNFTLTNL